MRPILLVFLLPLLASGTVACQERDGSCPVVEEVTPDAANRAEVVQVVGRDFAVGHDELFGDGRATPPTARLLVDPEMLELFAPDMADQEVELGVERVAFVSDTELEVTMPDLVWDDLVSAMEMFGVEIDTSSLPPLPLLPVPVVLYVANPTGCEASYDGDLTFNIEMPEEEGTP